MVKDDLSEDLKHLKSVKTMLNMSGVAVVQLDGLERSRTGKLLFSQTFWSSCILEGLCFHSVWLQAVCRVRCFPTALCEGGLHGDAGSGLLITAVSDR